MNDLFDLISNNVNSANAFAAVASAAAAALAFMTSLVSLGLSLSIFKHQRKHDELSLRPLPQVTVADYQHKLTVTLRNNGVGPMIVTRLVAGNGSEVRDQIMAWMPDLPDELAWTNFSGNVDRRSIAPGGSIVLLHLEGDDEDPEFAVWRDRTRAALKPLTVNVEYTNIYDTVLPPVQKSLNWFGRLLD